ncbi:hypothetical protein A203_19695 [Chromobacterium violaceum]
MGLTEKYVICLLPSLSASTVSTELEPSFSTMIISLLPSPFEFICIVKFQPRKLFTVSVELPLGTTVAEPSKVSKVVVPEVGRVSRPL